MEFMLPQLWFGRTPHFIIGHHTNGTFHEVKTMKVKNEPRKWEGRKDNQTAVRKLAELISQLRDVVKHANGKACVAIYNRNVRPGSLEVFTAEQDRKPLQEHVIKRFWKDPSTPEDE
jgi:hypothetical protein